MENLLGDLYSSLDSLYGIPLRDYLLGFDCDANDYTASILFNQIGIITVFISFIIVVAYYYIIDHPKLANIWGWLIFMGVNMALTFIYGYSTTFYDLDANLICTAFIEENSIAVTTSSCVGFGFANAIIGTLFFVIISLLLKWKSKTSRYIPF